MMEEKGIVSKANHVGKEKFFNEIFIYIYINFFFYNNQSLFRYIKKNNK